MDQEKGVNKYPTLCPLFDEQQPWDHRHGRDHPGADCFPVLLVPKARREQCPKHGSPNTYLFPCLC